MRRVLILCCIAALAVGCASETAEPLALDSTNVDSSGSSPVDGVEGDATNIDPASPIVRPPTPQDADIGATTTVDVGMDDAAPVAGAQPQRPSDVMPSDPMLPGAATPPTIGAFCEEHLAPAREILEQAEASGSISAEDRATVQSTLDAALDHCTPAEYFAFQQELFAFVDPTTQTTVPAPAVESELID